MGSRTAPEPGERRNRAHFALDDSGQLSIDFYIGLSIFLITVIVAATMVSGLLIGLQSKQIDYDAVAYRTGVILVEDPGEPNTVFNYETITEADEWEFIGIDQKDKVRRFGLTLYKSTPRTFSEQKIISFNNRTRFPALKEYRERIIFGTNPYRFNITLKILDDPEPPATPPVGDPYISESSYGYIRRVVLVKNQTSAEINMSRNASPYYTNTSPGDGKFYVNLNYTDLLDLDRAPHYWIEPPKEDIIVNMTNIQDLRNESLDPGDKIRLNTIRIRYVGYLYGGAIQEDFLPVEVTAVIDDDEGNPITFPWGVPAVKEVNSTINITFPAGYFIPPSAYANIRLIEMKVYYEFDSSTVNISQTNKTYNYTYNSNGFTPPSLNPAVMEVRVW